MKKSFQAYYRPSEETFKELWGNCMFVPDTNMLLNTYRYTESTRRELIGILQRISPQLWVPYQVGLEYQRCRPEVILQQEKVYDDIKKILEEILLTISKKLNLSQSHPLINKTEILKQIKRSFTSIQRKLDKQKSLHPNLLDNDPLRDTLTALFDGKVGEAFPSKKMDELYKVGEERYKKRIPPGYMDATKEGTEQYGDIVIWFQMIEKAKESKKPIIFITDDDKEDWWLWAKERKIGPRPELIEEMFKNTSQAFYMYGVERFMVYSRTYLKRRIDEKAIEEVRDVKIQRENRFVEALADLKMDVAKSLAIRKQALENILVSPASQTIADIMTSPARMKLTDMCASPASQTIADIMTSSASMKLSDLCASPASQTLANILASPTSLTLEDIYTSPASQTLADIMSSSTSIKLEDICTSPARRTLANILASPTSLTLADIMASRTSQTIADNLESHILEPIQGDKMPDESKEEKKSHKDEDQIKEE